MKKALALFLCILCCLTLCGTALADVPVYRIINNNATQNGTAVYTLPSESSQRLAVYYNGVIVQQTAEVSSDWALVTIGEGTGAQQGYILKKYLANPATSMIISRVETATINHSGSVMEPLVSRDGNRIMYLPNGTTVQVLGVVSSMTVGTMTEAYLHVMYCGLAGYVPQRYVQTASSQPTAFPVVPVVTATPYCPVVTSTPIPTEAPWNGPAYGTHPISQWPLEKPSFGTVAYVNNPNPMDRLHLRKNPKSGATSFGKYYNGTQVLVLDYVDAEWVHVAIGNLEGYMNTSFLVFDEAFAPASVLPIMTVNINNLNLREGQSTSSHSLGQYPKGTQVVLLGFNDTWAHVAVNGITGFMMGKYLK